MVRLKVSGVQLCAEIPIHFNSTMVRLKDALQASLNAFDDEFQFHYGSVKSSMIGLLTSSLLLFQFHYGSVKRK